MEDIRIGVYVCWCGTNIAKMVDVEDVAKEMKKRPNVVLASDYKYMCSDPGQDMIVNDIKEHKLNRVVVAACSPRIHELTFRKALKNAGLNPYMFEMVNIREQVSWVHTNRVEATKKAKALIAGAINRVRWHSSLDKRSVPINPATLVIGGGIAGISAALKIAGAGVEVFLLEKEKEIGGMLNHIDLSFPHFNSVSELIQDKLKLVKNHSLIKVFTSCEIEDIFGYVGNFEAKIKYENKSETLKFGSIIVATGLKPFNPKSLTNYGYEQHKNVITSLEFEKMLKNGEILTTDGSEPRHIAFIHCVGSRNTEQHSYCSRVCCNTALKQAKQAKQALPDVMVYNLYADMRSIGKDCEEFYARSFTKDHMFLMFDNHKTLPKIKTADSSDNCNLLIEVDELLSNEALEVPADLVVLMVAMEAQEDAKKISHDVGISMCGNNFFIERHPKLDPFATTTAGVYLAGTCQSPKDIPDSVAQANATAARILASIIKGSVEVEVTTAEVNEDVCCGCQTCINVCPYTAIVFDKEKNVSVVNSILCKGCGTCGSACPTGAIKSHHFTDQQILSQIEGLMQMSFELEEEIL
jgi:heterodisulfide reductase subunit A